MERSDALLFRYALHLGDDALVLAQRLGAWAGWAPTLEEDVALANIALDELGQARVLLDLASRTEGAGRSEDDLAYLREEREFRNLQLVEQDNGDFARTIVRQLFFATYQELLYGRLRDSGQPELSALAGKAVKEVAYHREHAVRWTLRLGDGTADSHARMRQALADLWCFTAEMFDPFPPAGTPRDGFVADGVAGNDASSTFVDPARLHSPWRERIAATLRDATLDLPDGPDRLAWAAGGGRDGIHTEVFGRMLAEMQHLHRSHPGAQW